MEQMTGGESPDRASPYTAALIRLVPKSEATLQRIAPTGDIYGQTPLTYEESLVAAYACLVEKDELQAITAEDISDTTLLYKWIVNLPLRSSDREVLLDNASRALFRNQLENLEKPVFEPVNGRSRELAAMYKAHIRKMFETDIIKFGDNIKIEVKGRGIMRNLSIPERMELFENQIRRAAKK